ncbi:unnamed protein product [Hydatigera taeniaeformis]|uniref:Ovule protein n=1 Tax=Hydatigena taeniaeformis TaxID=6205 RepID=A0A0R3WY53_HYDTA|nr:unnamed protein product [Hydatigera taeniaeformis]
MFKWRLVPRMVFSLFHGDQSHKHLTFPLTAKMNLSSKAILCALMTNLSLMCLVLIVSPKIQIMKRLWGIVLLLHP